MMKENSIKIFIRDTYKTSSPIPYIITAQIFMFILIHIFDLINLEGTSNLDLYNSTLEALSLPSSFQQLLYQPWALVSHPFIYQGIFNILFDCLWLYWIGNLFLSYLNTNQFLTTYIGGWLTGTLIFLALGSIGLFPTSSVWNTSAFSLAALISSTALLLPNLEIRLFIFGNVKLKIIAIVYLGLEFAFLVISNTSAAIGFLCAAVFGLLFILNIQKGNDWSKIFLFRKKRAKHLKIIQNNHPNPSYKPHPKDLPDQEVIDQILDKISVSGYESLTLREKEILFKASKQHD